MSDTTSLIRVGNLYKPHGIRGEIKMYPETDDPARLKGLTEVFIGKSAEKAQTYKVKALRTQQTARRDYVLLTLAGIENPDQAERIKGLGVYVRESDLPTLEEDEFYFDDLIGLEAIQEDGTHIGEVVEWIEAPAQELLVILREDESEVLIPMVSEFIVDINFDENQLIIRPIEGLINPLEAAE